MTAMTRDRKDELGLYCYYKVVKCYSVIWKSTWFSCILYTPGQLLKEKKRSITDILRKQRRWNNKILRTTNGRKKEEDKNRNIE